VVTERSYASGECPYCGLSLDPLPKAKKRCPRCGRPIYVRAGPDGFSYLLQEGDLHVLEEAWAEHRARQEYVEKTAAFGIDFEKLEAEMRVRNPKCSPRDVYWSGMNKAVLDAVRRGDWQTAKMAYFGMALQTWNESDEDLASDRALALQRQADRAELMGLLQGADVERNGVPDIRVGVIGCACTACEAGPHSRLWARDELTAPHIPHSGCRRDGWCACDYVVDP
jgi:hypothetical protein